MSASSIKLAIELSSDMNPDHEVYVIPFSQMRFDDIRKIAAEAYDEWFSADDVTNPTAYYDAIGSYISYMLLRYGYTEDVDYCMNFGSGWNADEEEE